MLSRYFSAEVVDFQPLLNELVALADRVAPLVEDVSESLKAEMRRGGNIMFEGAQGALLDVDVGTYPFVTSSNTIAGEAAVGTGLGPRDIHKVLGIVKAYTTRVGAGPFPTELFDETGEHLSRVGHEFGAVTGRPRRCGWFDAVALRRAVLHNSISSLGVTKLDVLDGLDTLRVCTGYRIDGEVHAGPPLLPHRFSECEPVYEEHPGWSEATAGITDFSKLPGNARKYLARLEELGEVPIDIVSTGPDRAETIVLRHPYD
jgi:adenylosuccinate synthase